MTEMEFERGAIRTMECLSEGWRIISGQYWIFFAITLAAMILQSLVPLSILTGPMFCGVFIAWFRLNRGERIGFEMLFEGFDFFVESLLATLVFTGIMILTMIPSIVLLVFGVFLGAAAGQNSHVAAGLMVPLVVAGISLFIMMVMTILMTLGLFVYPLIVDRKLKAIPAIKTSVRAVWANPGGVLGVLGVTSLITFVASLLCVLPVFLVLPWCFSTVGVAYRKIFPDLSGTLVP